MVPSIWMSQSASRSVGIEATNITIGGCSIVVKGNGERVGKECMQRIV